MKGALKIPALAIGSIILGMVSTATAQTGGTDKKGGGISSYSLQLAGGMIGRMEGMGNQQASSGQVTFTCTSDMQSPFFDWLKDAINGSTSKKECSVLETGYDGNVKSVTNMHNTSVTSVTMPALDVESKEHCKIKVVLNAESAKTDASSGKKLDQSSRAKPGEWPMSNFTVSVNGHDDVYAHVTNVGEITVKPNAGPGGRAEISNLKITCMCKPTELKKLEQWFTDFTKQSTNLNNPPSGTTIVITYMSSDKRNLFTVTYVQGCPFKVTEQGKPDATGMQAVVTEFYGKGIKFGSPN
jgi:hypothetical protein